MTPLEEQEAEPEVCTAVRPAAYDRCHRPAGHSGPHMCFGDNGTVAWALFR